MDFEFATEHESFRKEFRVWLAANLPPELCLDDASDDRVASDRETFERRRVWQKKMHAAGWVAMTWPKEYGGRDAGLIERIIWDEEYTAARAPVLPGNMGLSLVGPTIIHWGTEEQKRRHLPAILNDPVGEVRARRPHLLAVDDEVVALVDGARPEACQIGSRRPARRSPGTRSRRVAR